MHKQLRSHGFTVIELMVVVAVLAAISAIAIPMYTGYIKSAYLQEARANIASLRLAEEEYFLENNVYFFGANVTELQTNSAGLWKVAKGKETTGAPDGINFTYAVTNAAGYTITAIGKANTPVANEPVTETKN